MMIHLNGIKDLPEELVVKPVESSPSVEPRPANKACEVDATIIGFTN